MIAKDTAQMALDTVWACMLELAEYGHEFFVITQAAPNRETAIRGAEIAARLETLVKAAILLAEITAQGPDPDPP